MAENKQLPDKILDLTDLLDEQVSVLIEANRVFSYQDYLRINFAAVHGSSLARYIFWPTVAYRYEDEAQTFVDKGTWRWQCRVCGNVQFADRLEPHAFCLMCLWPDGAWARIRFPDDIEEIEEILLQFQGHRTINYLRDWRPGWSIEFLQARVERARMKEAQGLDPKKLSIAPSRSVGIGEIVQPTLWNNNIKEPLDDISGDNGPTEFRHGIAVGEFTTEERDAISSPPDGMFFWNETTGRMEYRGASAYEGLVDTNRVIVDENLMGELIQAGIDQHLADAIHVNPPGQPEGLWGSLNNTSNAGSDDFRLQWQDSDDGDTPDQYDLQWREEETDSWTLVEDIGSSPFIWEDGADVAPGALNIMVRIKANNLGGDSDWTPIIQLERIASVSTPSRVRVTSVTSSSLSFAWDRPRSISGLHGAGSWTLIDEETNSQVATGNYISNFNGAGSATVTGLTANHPYRLHLAPHITGGFAGSTSRVLGLTTLP